MKFSFKFFLPALILFGLTSCDNNNTEPEDVPPYEPNTSQLYVVDNGVMTGNVPGGITACNITDGTSVIDAFSAANGGQSIGDTPQSAIIYDDKMYVAVYQSNLIWVLDAKTLEIISSIRPTAPAAEPRELTAHNGKVYVSMFSGHVCRIDTDALTIDATVAVGPNPEGLAVCNGELYVANSDGMNWENGNINSSVSIIDLATLSEHKINVGLNPTGMVSNGTDVFVQTMGNYYDIPAKVSRITDENVSEICEGTFMAIRNDELYVINAPLNGGETTYKVYSTAGTYLREMVEQGVDSPAGIAVDSSSGKIAILSYTMNGEWAAFSDPCYAALYDTSGKYLTRFSTGVGSVSAVFYNYQINTDSGNNADMAAASSFAAVFAASAKSSPVDA